MSPLFRSLHRAFERHAHPRRVAILLVIFLAAAAGALAQTGTLTGRVTEEGTGTPLSGATIRILGSDATTRQSGAISRTDGTYTVRGITPGRYTVLVTYISYASFEKKDVEITAGGTVTVDAVLRPQVLGGNEIVVSASRRPEKETEAPASVSVISAREIQERPALTPIDHVRGVQGVDIVQSGLTQNNVVTRGFNNVFSGMLTTLTDNRTASVPSLRVNAYNFIPLVNEDIQQMEIIRGPASALYGPNASNGVLHIITRSPFSSAGTWLSLAGGERSVLQGMFRHAGTIGDNFGYKISGQYMSGDDWEFTDTAEVSARAAALAEPGVNPDTLKIGVRDNAIRRAGGELRLDYIPMEDMTAILAIGRNQAINNVDLTGVGAAQVKDWSYTYYQLRLLYKDLFVQGFFNQSDAGKTYLLRTGAPIVDRSNLFVAQAQHTYSLADDVARLTYGLDLQLTNPVTDSTINGSNEGKDGITEIGAYAQGDIKLIADLLNLVAAVRVDKHSSLSDPVLSPRAALVFSPIKDQTFRFTYNRAFSAPTTNELFMDIVAQTTPVFDVRASGVPETGFSFRFDPQGNPYMHSTLAPDPRAPLPIADVHLAWEGVKRLMKTSLPDSLHPFVDQIPAPPAGVVRPELRIVNPETGLFDPYDLRRLTSREPVEPTITSTLELGYKGTIAERISLSIDLYRSHYENFVGPLEVITPTVFMEQSSLQEYLRQILIQGGMTDSAAALQAAYFAPRVSGIPSFSSEFIGVPIGTVSAEQAADPTAVMLTFRNYGEITLYGYDIGLQVGITEEIGAGATVSYVDKNFIPDLDGISDLSLNAPKFKYALMAEYRSAEHGLAVNARFRHVDGFKINSGVYIGGVPGFSTFDLNIDYRIPFVEGLNFSLTAQNLLTWVEKKEPGATESSYESADGHAEFFGTAEIGRLVLGRLSYSFR